MHSFIRLLNCCAQTISSRRVNITDSERPQAALLCERGEWRYVLRARPIESSGVSMQSFRWSETLSGGDEVEIVSKRARIV